MTEQTDGWETIEQVSSVAPADTEQTLEIVQEVAIQEAMLEKDTQIAHWKNRALVNAQLLYSLKKDFEAKVKEATERLLANRKKAN